MPGTGRNIPEKARTPFCEPLSSGMHSGIKTERDPVRYAAAQAEWFNVSGSGWRSASFINWMTDDVTAYVGLVNCHSAALNVQGGPLIPPEGRT